MTTTAHIDRIRALRAKTEANGCTPGEVEAASALAAKLMDKYGLTEADVAPRENVSFFFRKPANPENRTPAEEALRQDRARQAYHRNGVHIDANSFAEGCLCRSCQAARGTAYTAPRPSAPRSSRARTNGSHAGCTHEATKSARAKCRKERGW